ISFVVATALTDALVFALKQGNHSATVNRCFSAARRSANLRLRVADVMHRGDAIPKVGLHDTIRDVVLAMTQHPLGAVCVTASNGRLDGLVTDRDLSRAMQAEGDTGLLRASEIMTAAPLTVAPDTLLRDALRLLSERLDEIPVLPVVDPQDGCCLGLI